MHDLSPWMISLILFALLLAGIEVGFLIGRKVRDRYSESARQHAGAIRASMLGILALLLGFTFSQSLQRFEARSEAIVDEANAIGTAWLRAQLTPSSVRQRAPSVLRDYLKLRVQMAGRRLGDPELEALLENVQESHGKLWQSAQQATAEGRGPITALYVQSINELIDSYGRREAELRRHVPVLVLLVLFVTFIITAFVVGVSSGLDGDRPPMASYLAALVIVLCVFIIMDLDHPRSGLIEVSRESLIDLHESIEANDSELPAVAASIPQRAIIVGGGADAFPAARSKTNHLHLPLGT